MIQFCWSNYRYGYQGSEGDDEIKGDGNSYTTFYRMLDPRVGKWFSIDPKVTAWESPYVSMGNNPIWRNDKLGDSVKISSETNANIIAADFNAIYRDKYGVSDAFEVSASQTTREDEEGNITSVTEYAILTNPKAGEGDFWGTDEYSKAMFDVLNSKDVIRVYFMEENGKNPPLKDIKGRAYPYPRIDLYINLERYALNGTRKGFTFGGVLMHELLYHKHSQGARDKKRSPNNGAKRMRIYYDLHIPPYYSTEGFHYGGNLVDKNLSGKMETTRLNGKRKSVAIKNTRAANAGKVLRKINR